jgi:hypothetical protein
VQALRRAVWRYEQINFGFAPNGMDRAQLIFEQSFERAISNKRVSLFAVLCAGKVLF